MLWAEGNAFKTISLTKKVISFEILKFYYKLISVESLKVSNFWDQSQLLWKLRWTYNSNYGTPALTDNFYSNFNSSLFVSLMDQPQAAK